MMTHGSLVGEERSCSPLSKALLLAFRASLHKDRIDKGGTWGDKEGEAQKDTQLTYTVLTVSLCV